MDMVNAAGRGNLEEVRRILETGADVHTQHDLALQRAVGHNHLQVVRFLLQHGANIHASNDIVIRIAIVRRNYDILRLLLAAGGDPSDLPENLRYLIPRVITPEEYLLLQPFITSILELPDRWIVIARDETLILLK
jgi:hypothetical protein